jgi:SAM-dependent methyltransferase
MFGTQEAFTYRSCLGCGSLYIDQIPSNLATYYSSANYYSFSPLVESQAWKRTIKKIREAILRYSNFTLFKPVYADWWKILQPNKATRIADIGCGNGQLLYELYAAGYQHLRGIDPFITKEKRIEKSLLIQKSDIFQVKEQSDLIMFHHALEHMPDPESVLKKVYELLPKGGKVLIRIPVSDAQVWKDEGTFWVQLDAPRHLHIPSIKGLQGMAEKLGFHVISTVFDSTEFQFWGTEIYKKGLPLRESNPEKLFSTEELSKFKNKALLYNEEGKGDQACIYLEKIG